MDFPRTAKQADHCDDGPRRLSDRPQPLLPPGSAEGLHVRAVAGEKKITDADVLRQAFGQEPELVRAALDSVDEKKSFFHTFSSLNSSISLARIVNSIRRKLPLSSNMWISYLPPSVG